MQLSKINYKSLAKSIISSIKSLDPEQFSYFVSIKEYYSDSIIEGTNAFNEYIIDKLGENMEDLLSMRPILVELFRESESETEENVVEMLATKLKKEIGRLKRHEKYKKDLAIKNGETYVSELVRTNDNHPKKIKATEKQINKVESKVESNNVVLDPNSDVMEIDIYKFLNQQKAEVFNVPTINKDKYSTTEIINYPTEPVNIQEPVINKEPEIETVELKKIMYLDYINRYKNKDYFVYLISMSYSGYEPISFNSDIFYTISSNTNTTYLRRQLKGPEIEQTQYIITASSFICSDLNSFDILNKLKNHSFFKKFILNISGASNLAETTGINLLL